MKFSRLFLILHVLLSGVILSCNDPIDPPIRIPFGDIVGKYEGLSRICEVTSSPHDTICADGVKNILHVMVYDETSIVMNDETNIYGNIRLYYTQTINENDAAWYYFTYRDDTKDCSLYFNDVSNTIRLDSKSSQGNPDLRNYFAGVNY